MNELIALNLSDGTACYGRPTGKGSKYWLRRVSTATHPAMDEVAPDPIRAAAEQALTRGGWAMGDVIEVDAQPQLFGEGNA